MDYVTDTHSLVWYFTDDNRLSRNALQAFQASEGEGTVIVPAVVLAEIMFIAKKGRITLSFEDTLNRIEESENFEIASLNAEILRTADKIEIDLEMHDKLIAATALHYSASLITKDKTLREAGRKAVQYLCLDTDTIFQGKGNKGSQLYGIHLLSMEKRLMRQHGKNSSHKLVGSSHNSLSERLSFLFPFEEISLKKGIASDGSGSHEIEEPSEMAVTPFGDFACALKLARLKDRRVNACIGNKGLMRGEIANVAYLSEESSPCSVSNTFDGGNNLHFLICNRLTDIMKHAGEHVQLLHQVKECRNLLWQNGLLGKAVRSDRVFSGLNNFIGADREPSAPPCLLQSLCDDVGLSGSYQTGRGECFKEIEHGVGKDVANGREFRKNNLQKPLNLIFGGSDTMANRFSFSGNIPEVLGVLRNGELLDRVPMCQKESGDGKGIFLVGFGFTQREFGKIADQKGIDDKGTTPFVRQERKKIDVVTACGLHASHDSGEVFAARSNSSHNLGKTLLIHSNRQGKTDIAFAVNAGSRKRILGNINTYKKTIHTNTSLNKCFGQAGIASRPILHVDEGSMTQSTYCGYGRQGTDSFKGSLAQETQSSPAFLPQTGPTLTYMGKTQAYYYNTNLSRRSK